MDAAVASRRRIRLSVGGEWLDGRGGDPVPLVSPATGDEIALVEQGTREDVVRAVEAAERAREPLARTTAFERAALCHAVADLLLERKEQIAHDIALEQGKPYRAEALPEVEVAADMFRDAAECGSPFDESTTMGPVANEPTAAKMDEHLADAVDRGAELLAGGARGDGFPTRLYYLPTVIDGVRPGMKLDAEETFGPVAPVMTFSDEVEALAWANACPLGLNGSVFTRDIGRAIRVAERLQTGTVNVNETSAYWQPHTPAGGFTGKRSGIGRIGGMYTLLEMTQVKTIAIDVSERA